jgi:hypothetical protein
MIRRLGCILVGGLIVLGTTRASAPELNLVISMTWKGSVDDQKLIKTAPSCITSAKGLEKIWKAWKIKVPAPKIDFSKFILIVAVTEGSGLSLDGSLDKKGNLEVVGIATRDIAPGFRYVLGKVGKDGVKTVNGKKLPSE